MRRMLSVAFLILTLGLSVLLAAQNTVPPYRMAEAPVEARVADLLARMTLARGTGSDWWASRRFAPFCPAKGGRPVTKWKSVPPRA